MITIVVGAQYGGEGKGKVCAYLAFADGVDISCRCGGPNSSHTVQFGDKVHKLRMMPAAAVIRPTIDVYFGAGSLIHIPTLFAEAEEIGFCGRLVVDPLAGIVTEEIIAEQRRDSRYQAIGSTLTGTGLASALRAQRKLGLARSEPRLRDSLGDVSMRLIEAMAANLKIIVEGHQGYGLSNYHGDYPYTSSRDSTAAAMLSELGIGPLVSRRSTKIVLATKVFPTRNHAGQLPGELTQDDATTFGIEEFGGGAWGIPNRRRRVGIFDASLVRRAALANGATEIALTGADYLDRQLRGMTKYVAGTELDEFIVDLARHQGMPPVRYVSTGAGTVDMFRMHSSQLNRATKAPGQPSDLFGRTN